MRDFYMIPGVQIPNMSDIECVREVDNKGKEFYKFKNPPP